MTVAHEMTKMVIFLKHPILPTHHHHTVFIHNVHLNVYTWRRCIRTHNQSPFIYFITSYFTLIWTKKKRHKFCIYLEKAIDRFIWFMDRIIIPHLHCFILTLQIRHLVPRWMPLEKKWWSSDSHSTTPIPGPDLTSGLSQLALVIYRKHVTMIYWGILLVESPSRELTVRTWKWDFPKGYPNIPTIHFQVRTVSFREGKMIYWGNLLGGWTNPSEKYESKWESSPILGVKINIFQSAIWWGILSSRYDKDPWP